MFPEVELYVGQHIFYFDDDAQMHAAVIARILLDEAWMVEHTRPRLVISFLGFDGVWRPRNFVEPAFHDGVRGRKLNKWCLKDDWEKGLLND